MAILVDTSVLIGYLKGTSSSSVEKFQFILDSGIPFGITPLVYLEVLQGAKTEREFETLKAYLQTQRFYELKDRESYERAAKLYALCKKNGFQVGSTIDCLIAQAAIEHDLLLLHDDEDFLRIAKISVLSLYK